MKIEIFLKDKSHINSIIERIEETRWELRMLLTDVEDFVKLWDYIIKKECIETIKIIDDWQTD